MKKLKSLQDVYYILNYMLYPQFSLKHLVMNISDLNVVLIMENKVSFFLSFFLSVCISIYLSF